MGDSFVPAGGDSFVPASPAGRDSFVPITGTPRPITNEADPLLRNPANLKAAIMAEPGLERPVLETPDQWMIPLIPGLVGAEALKLAEPYVKPIIQPAVDWLGKTAGELGAKMIGPEERMLIDRTATRALQEPNVGSYAERYGETPLINPGEPMPAAPAPASGPTTPAGVLGLIRGPAEVAVMKGKPIAGTVGDSSVIDTTSTLPGVRPSKFATPEQQATAEQIIQSIPSDAMDAAKRGSIPLEAARQAATNLGWSKDTIFKLKFGQSLNQEQSLAVTGILTDEVDKLNRMSKAWQQAVDSGAGDETTDALASSLLQQKVDVTKLAMVRSASASEQGRALNSLKYQYEAIQGAETDLAQKLAKADPGVRELVLKKLGEIGNNPNEVRMLMLKLSNWALTPMFVEAATANRLSGPASWMIGGLTQPALKMLDLPVRVISGALDKSLDPVLTRIYGEGRQRWAGEVWSDAKGMVDGISDGILLAVKTLGSESTAMDIAEKRGFQVNAAIKGRPGKDTLFDNFLDFLGPKVRMAYRPFSAIDNLLKPIFNGGTFRAYVYRTVAQEGLEAGTDAFAQRVAQLIQNPPFHLIESADKESNIPLLREKVPQTIRLWNQIRNMAPVIKFFDPFVNVTMNAFRNAGRFTPGVGMALPTEIGGMSERGPAMDMLSKQIIGGAALYPLYKYAMQGKIHMEAPQNPEERDKFFADGHQANSVEIGNKSITFGRLSPFSEWFVTAKLLADAVQNKDDKTATGLIGGFMAGQLKNFVDKTFMQGIADTIEAVEAPDRYGAKWVRNAVAGAMMPNIGAAAARAEDPIIRQQNTLVDSFKSRIPGESQTLLPQRGLFGEPHVRPGGMDASGKAMRFLSPVQISTIQEEPVRKALAQAGVKLTYPSQEVNGRKLTPEEFDFVLRNAGPEIKKSLITYLQRPDFQAATPGERQRILNEEVIDPALKMYKSPFVLSAELRALKIDPASVPMEIRPALTEIIDDKTEDGKPSLYGAGNNDAWKKDTMERAIKALKATHGRR